MRVGRWVLLFWICFVLRAVFYACALPLWEGADEYAHYARIEYLATNGLEPSRDTQLPADVADSLTHVPVHNFGMSYDEFWKLTPAERYAGFAGPKGGIYEAQQPPLFYWLLAPIEYSMRSAPLAARVIWMRLACVLLASVCVPLGFFMARRIFGQRAPALGATALIAAMPVLTFTATHVSNEALAISVGTLVALLALRLQSEPHRFVAVLSLAAVLGAALLTKAYFLALLPPLALLLLYRPTRKGAAIALAGSLAIAGWWYWHTWSTTGSLTGNVILVIPAPGDILRAVPRFPVFRAVDFAWMSFVWMANWSFIFLRSWMYHVIAALAVLALAGVVRLLWKRDAAVALLSAFVGSFALAIAYFALATFASGRYPGAFGWYFCCLIAPVAILLVAGLRAIAPAKLKPVAVPIFVMPFAGLELFGTHILMLPYYTGVIAHLPNGGLPAFRLSRMANGGWRTMLERLAFYKPAWLTASVLGALWALFLLATLALMVLSIHLALAEKQESSFRS